MFVCVCVCVCVCLRTERVHTCSSVYTHLLVLIHTYLLVLYAVYLCNLVLHIQWRVWIPSRSIPATIFTTYTHYVERLALCSKHGTCLVW
jgi:hypothetical protein